MPGYIYLRTSIYYDLHNAVKFGLTTNIYNRDFTYATGEIKRGYFTTIVEILSNHNIEDVEKIVMDYWNNKYNINRSRDGGHKFFDKACIGYLDEALQTIININYRYLDKAEIEKIHQITNTNIAAEYNNRVVNLTK